MRRKRDGSRFREGMQRMPSYVRRTGKGGRADQRGEGRMNQERGGGGGGRMGGEIEEMLSVR